MYITAGMNILYQSQSILRITCHSHMYLEPSEYRLWLQLEQQPLLHSSAVPLQDTPSPTLQMEKICDNNGYIHLAAALYPCCAL